MARTFKSALVAYVFDDKKEYIPDYWYARLLNTSFMQKMFDFFLICFGPVNKKHIFVGISDCLLLYPCLISYYVISLEFNSKIASLLKIVFLAIIFTLPKVILSLGLTIAFSPFIGLFNIATYLISRPLRNIINQAQSDEIDARQLSMENVECNSHKKISEILKSTQSDTWSNQKLWKIEKCEFNKKESWKIYKKRAELGNNPVFIVKQDPQLTHAMRALNFLHINKIHDNDDDTMKLKH